MHFLAGVTENSLTIGIYGAQVSLIHGKKHWFFKAPWMLSSTFRANWKRRMRKIVEKVINVVGTVDSH
jgi:hypothetical protein